MLSLGILGKFTRDKFHDVSTFVLTDSRLASHLFHVLCTRDTVVVPGFGTFAVKAYGADIQLVSGLFLPPARRVSFVPIAAGDGQSLVQQIAAVEEIDPKMALQSLRVLLQNWLDRLARGERLVVNNVGSFLLRNGDQWVFQASIESNFLPESFGLPVYRLPLLASQKSDVRALSTPAPPARTQSEKRFPSAALDSHRRVEYNREKWLAPVRHAAVFTGIVSLLALSGTKEGFKEDMRTIFHEASWTRLPKIEWPQPVDLFSQPPHESPSELKTPATPIKEQAEREFPKSPPAVESSEAVSVDVLTKSKAEEGTADNREKTSSTGSYYLVVGAFSEKENAHRLLDQLKSKGHSAEIVNAAVGMTKVAALRAESYEEALRQKESLRSAFPGVWIFHK